MDLEVGREAGYVVAAQDIESNAGGEIFIGIERHLVCALAGVGDRGVEIWPRGRRERIGDAEGEMEGEGEADDVKARPNVRRGCWDANGEFFLCHD